MKQLVFVAMIAVAVTLGTVATAHAQSQSPMRRGYRQAQPQGKQSALIRVAQPEKFRSVAAANADLALDNLNNLDEIADDVYYSEGGNAEMPAAYVNEVPVSSAAGHCDATGNCVIERRGRHAANKAAGRGVSAVLNPCQASARRALARPWARRVHR